MDCFEAPTDFASSYAHVSVTFESGSIVGSEPTLKRIHRAPTFENNISRRPDDMAHIADCMIASTEYGLNNFIAKELTPQNSMENLPDEKEKYVWRMHQPTEPRKYQLFPAKDKMSLSSGRNTPEQDQLPASGRRSKSKEPALLRRRKPSVSELGPMTTVQEVAMDSRKSGKMALLRRGGVNEPTATIPGRPPLLERSISAAGQWRQNVFGDTMLSMISAPTIEEKQAECSPHTPWPSSSTEKTAPKRSDTPPGPKPLEKLIIPIPSTTIAMPEHLISKCQSACEMIAPEVPPKSPGRVACGRKSPQSQRGTASALSRSNPNSSDSSLSSTEGPSTAPAGRTGHRPWDTPISAAPTSAPPDPPSGHFRNQSDQPISRDHQSNGHRREQSETSIMDRGRPKKKPFVEPVGVNVTEKQQASQRELTDEEKAFATLPTGVRAMKVDSKLDTLEIEAIRRQAVGQAAKFHVLSTRDVDILSRELRALDERCDYLRKTHRSLRAGRRNLHERICSYLRSPRVARFSTSAILKQEEALVELDTSIDDWVSKLEQAENRRTRVRQKLLEHVAAALTIPSPPSSATTPSVHTSSSSNHNHKTHRFVDARHNMNTPPRSPTKAPSPLSPSSHPPPSPPRSPTSTKSNASSSSSSSTKKHNRQKSSSPSQSPERLAQHLRITSPEPPPPPPSEPEDSRVSLQSIKIYADSDVYALLANVEEEFNRMGELETPETPVYYESKTTTTTSRCKSPFGTLTSATYEAEKGCA